MTLSLDYQIFLGIPLDSLFQAQLKQVPPPLHALFIHPEYLQQVEYAGQSYLGKVLDSLIEIQTLDSMEANIYSLLARLVADYQKKPLVLLALPKSVS
jgi:hypothetical protein